VVVDFSPGNSKDKMVVNNIEVTDKLISITRYILDSVSDEGNWESPEHEPWSPIITVCNVDHLLSCGMKEDDEWPISRDGSMYDYSINKSLKYLNSQINPDGSFGADFWDTCRMAVLVLKRKLQQKITNFTNLEMYIENKYRADYLSNHDYDWAGPGVYAACADYYLRKGQNDVAKNIIDSVITLQKNDGSFVGHEKRTGGYVVNPIWHTSQVIMTVLGNDIVINEDIVNAAKQYLIDKQSPDTGGYEDFGNYGIYYTAYAILGFLSFSNPPENLKRALSCLMASVSNDGKAGDPGGTIMTALALGKYLGSDLNSLFDSIQVKRNKSLLSENKALKQKIEELSTEVNTFKTRYKDADIVLTKKEVWKWGILISIFVSVIMFVIPVLTNLVKSIIPKQSDSRTTHQVINQPGNTSEDDSTDDGFMKPGDSSAAKEEQ